MFLIIFIYNKYNKKYIFIYKNIYNNICLINTYWELSHYMQGTEQDFERKTDTKDTASVLTRLCDVRPQVVVKGGGTS